MIKDLESLVQLQTIDLKIHELLESQKEFPKTLSELERLIASSQKSVAAINDKCAALVSEKKSIEEKVIDAKIALERSQERLSSIKTNREYDAVHAEIENFKSIIAGSDNRIKQLVQEADKYQLSLEEVKAEAEKVRAENESKINEMKTAISSVDSRVARLKQERGAITASVSKTVLRAYDHILSRKKNGQVLSFVNDSTHICSSCFKVLETQLVNEIRKGNKPLLCQNCGAIFIWGEKALEKRPAEPVE
jgi:predicted  nucleic acid-binding Zn-ribbon protein